MDARLLAICWQLMTEHKKHTAGNTRVGVAFRGPLGPHVIRGSTVLELSCWTFITLQGNVITVLLKVPSGFLLHHKYSDSYVAISFSL